MTNDAKKILKRANKIFSRKLKRALKEKDELIRIGDIIDAIYNMQIDLYYLHGQLKAYYDDIYDNETV